MHDEDDWVEIHSYGAAFEAEMARDFLEQNGVPAMLRGNSVTVNTMVGVSGPTADVRLLVPPEHVAQAKEILAALRPEPS